MLDQNSNFNKNNSYFISRRIFYLIYQSVERANQCDWSAKQDCYLYNWVCILCHLGFPSVETQARVTRVYSFTFQVLNKMNETSQPGFDSFV